MSVTQISDSDPVTIQSSHESKVNADETLLEFYQKLDTDYDLKIDLKANWNNFFANVVLPGPSGDDTDDASGNDISGASYVSFGEGTSSMPHALLSAAKGASASSNSGQGAFWAGCLDSNSANANEGLSNTHIQSVARGLVGLFSSSSALNASDARNVIVLEDGSGSSDDDIASANADFEIRISESSVREWMADQSGGAIGDGSYGYNVFTQDQIEQLLNACSDMGRYHIHNGVATDDLAGTNERTDIKNGHRVLALRENDRLQVRVTVYDTTGTIAQGSTTNKRVWLVSMLQAAEGKYDSTDGYNTEA